MSCYFRRLKEIFAEAGVEVNSSNKKRIDRVIHQTLGIGYQDCPTAWRRLKQEILADPQKRRGFVSKLKNAAR
jgi:hypothetical protein